jgi:hypothetical protein
VPTHTFRRFGAGGQTYEKKSKGKVMSDNLNLALEIVESRDPSGGRPPSLAATVYLETVCSYLKGGGAPTLTADCTSLSEFEQEITRLKVECDAILEEAARRFAAASDQGAFTAEAAQAREPISSPVPTAKTPRKLDQELRVADRMTREVRQALGRR